MNLHQLHQETEQDAQDVAEFNALCDYVESQGGIVFAQDEEEQGPTDENPVIVAALYTGPVTETYGITMRRLTLRRMVLGLETHQPAMADILRPIAQSSAERVFMTMTHDEAKTIRKAISSGLALRLAQEERTGGITDAMYSFLRAIRYI